MKPGEGFEDASSFSWRLSSWVTGAALWTVTHQGKGYSNSSKKPGVGSASQAGGQASWV